MMRPPKSRHKHSTIVCLLLLTHCWAAVATSQPLVIGGNAAAVVEAVQPEQVQHTGDEQQQSQVSARLASPCSTTQPAVPASGFTAQEHGKEASVEPKDAAAGLVAHIPVLLKDIQILPSLPGAVVVVDHFTIRIPVVIKTPTKQQALDGWVSAIKAVYSSAKGNGFTGRVHRTAGSRQLLASYPELCHLHRIQTLAKLCSAMSGVPITNISITCSSAPTPHSSTSRKLMSAQPHSGAMMANGSPAGQVAGQQLLGSPDAACDSAASLEVSMRAATTDNIQRLEAELDRCVKEQLGQQCPALVLPATFSTVVRADVTFQSSNQWTERACTDWAARATQAVGSTALLLACGRADQVQHSRRLASALSINTLPAAQEHQAHDAATAGTAQQSVVPGAVGGAVAGGLAAVVGVALFLMHARAPGCCGHGLCPRQPKVEEPASARRSSISLALSQSFSKARGMGSMLSSHNPLFTSTQQAAAEDAEAQMAAAAQGKPVPELSATQFPATESEPLPCQSNADTPTRLPAAYKAEDHLPMPDLFTTTSWAVARSSGAFSRSRGASCPGSDGPSPNPQWPAGFAVESNMHKVQSSSGMGSSFSEAKSWSPLTGYSLTPQGSLGIQGTATSKPHNYALQASNSVQDSSAVLDAPLAPSLSQSTQSTAQAQRQMPLHLAVWPSSPRDPQCPRSQSTTPNRSPLRQQGPATGKAFSRRCTWDTTCFNDDMHAFRDAPDTCEAPRRQSGKLVLVMPEPVAVGLSRLGQTGDKSEGSPMQNTGSNQQLTAPNSNQQAGALCSSAWQLLAHALDTPAVEAEGTAQGEAPEGAVVSARHFLDPGSICEPPSMKDLPEEEAESSCRVLVVQKSRSRLDTSQLSQSQGGSSLQASHQMPSLPKPHQPKHLQSFEPDMVLGPQADDKPRAAPPKRSMIHAHVQNSGMELVQRMWSTPVERQGGAVVRVREPITTTVPALLTYPQPSPPPQLHGTRAGQVEADQDLPPSDSYLHEAIQEQKQRILGRCATDPVVRSAAFTSTSAAQDGFLHDAANHQQQRALGRCITDPVVRSGASTTTNTTTTTTVTRTKASESGTYPAAAVTSTALVSRCSSQSRATMDLTPVMRRDPGIMTSNQTSRAVSGTSVSYLMQTHPIASASLPTMSAGASQLLPRWSSDTDDETRFIREVEAAAKAIAERQLSSDSDTSQDEGSQMDRSSWTNIVQPHFHTASNPGPSSSTPSAGLPAQLPDQAVANQSTPPVSGVTSANRRKLQLDRGTLMSSYRTAMMQGKSSYSSSITDHPSSQSHQPRVRHPSSQGQHKAHVATKLPTPE